MSVTGRPGPGLDPAVLRGLLTGTRDLSLIRSRVEAHLEAHRGYLAFSGGKDSLAVLHQVLQVDPETPIVFFDSGFEFPETYRYLHDIAALWRLNLEIIPARLSTLQMLRSSGCWDHHAAPGPALPDLHTLLVSEPSAVAHRRYGRGELWGVRSQESRGRAAAYANALRAATCGCHPGCTGRARRSRHGGVIARVDGTVAYGPVWDWTTAEVWSYLARHHLPINPVYDRLRAVGAPEHALRVAHVLDGNHLESGRGTWLRRGWPDLFDELATLLPRLREFV